MFFICLINIFIEGNTTTASTLFGVLCLFITALFAGVVMRLRFPYALSTLLAMLIAGVWSLTHSPGLQLSEAVMGASMMTIGVAMILVAGFSIESEERGSYLLGLQHDLQATELAWANMALKQISNIDNLTRLPNRRALDERAALLWQSCTLARESFSTIVIDVDHFKAVNDAYGHLFGDDTLRHIAAILPQALRSADDMAARFGGEEFVLLLPDTGREEAIAVAERIRLMVESAPSHIDRADPSLRITVSCGVSTYRPGGKLKWNDLITTADQALYQAKRNGRNRVEYFACEEPSQQLRRATDPSSRRLSGLLRARIASTGAITKSSTRI
jgi:diguanylate cyclase (GGDEF)-like protein